MLKPLLLPRLPGIPSLGRSHRRWPQTPGMCALSLACLVGLLLTGLPRQSAVADPITGEKALALEALDLQTKNEKVVAAIEEFREGHADHALELLEEAVQDEPTLPPAKIMLARMLLVDGQLAEGRRLLEEVAQTDGTNPDVYALFGNIALSEGRLSDATLNFRNLQNLAGSKELDPALARKFQVRSLAGLAAVAEIRRDFAAAEIPLKQWLELDPTASAHNRLARARALQNDPEGALQHLQAASQLEPKLDPPETTLGWFLTEANQTEQAEARLKEAVAKYPQETKAHFGLANWLLGQERVDESAQAVAAARKVDPDAPRLKFLDAILARHANDLDRATSLLRELVTDSPGEFGPTNQLALVLSGSLEREDRQQALKLAEENLQRHGGSSEGFSTLGWVLFKAGRYRDAEQIFQRAITNGVLSPETAYYVARLRIEQGNAAEAERLLKLALDAPLGQFFSRSEARQLLAELQQSAPAAEETPAGDTPRKEAVKEPGTKPAAEKPSAPAAGTKPAATKPAPAAPAPPAGKAAPPAGAKPAPPPGTRPAVPAKKP